MKSVVSISILLLLSFIEVEAQNEWRLDKEGNGIKVFTRKVEGSVFRGFRAFTTLSADISRVEKILDRYEEFYEWHANGEEIKLIEKLSDSTNILYVHSHLPWPLSDRDIYFTQTKIISNEPRTITYKNECLPDWLPENKGIVRVNIASGFWRLTQKEGLTEVEFTWNGDPGGSIPGWVTNLFIVSGPFKTFANLKELLGE